MLNNFLFLLKEIKDYFISIYYQLTSIREINQKEFRNFLSINEKMFKKLFHSKRFKNDEIILTTAYAIGHPGYQTTNDNRKIFRKILNIQRPVHKKNFFLNNYSRATVIKNSYF